MNFNTFLLAVAAAIGVMAIDPRAMTTGCNNCTNSTTTATAYVTQTVTAYETYCPKKTVFTHGTKTYTGHKKQWVTVTDCSPACTISNQVGLAPSVVPAGMHPRFMNGTVPAETTMAAPVSTPCPCSAPLAQPCPTSGPSVCQCPAPNKGSAFPTGSPNSASSSSGSGSSGSGSSSSDSGSGSMGPNKGSSNGTIPTGSGSNVPQQASNAGKTYAGQAAAALAIVAGAAALL